MDSNQIANKGMVFVFIIFSLLLIPHYTQADYQTTLSFSGYIQSGAGALDAGTWSAPIVYDWNSDGLKDLLVGNKGASNTAYVNFYQNIGTDASPLFNGYTNIMTCNTPCTIAGG
jgi:hypothetical protein